MPNLQKWSVYSRGRNGPLIMPVSLTEAQWWRDQHYRKKYGDPDNFFVAPIDPAYSLEDHFDGP